jgi:hypothetical protein
MKPSLCTVSEHLNALSAFSEEIDECLLIGEQVGLIHEVGLLYNELRATITPAYLTDVEYEWLKQLGLNWNAICTEYSKHMGDSLTPDHQQNLDDITDAFKDALDDLMDNMGDLPE